jgi:O-antigen ligase
MPIDLVFMLGVLGMALKLLRERRPIILPPSPLSLAIALTLLALSGGAVVGHAAGVGFSAELRMMHALAYVALLPIIVVNLDLDERQIKCVLLGAGLLAVVKALLGLAVVATGRGMAIGGATLTYYEPVANWITMIVALIAIAALSMRARPPAWLLAGLPLIVASLLLSYRRSFWIGFGLALVAVLLLGLSPLGRRLIVPILALLAAAVWMLGSVALQSDTPLGQRLQSLSTSKLQSQAYDRYRLDERANVLAALREDPVTGLGIGVPWQASTRSLPVEVNVEHQYVHFAALFWWLRLGLIGLLAYAATLLGGVALSWRIWRRAREPLVRAVGLGSLCGLIGLLAIESTAAFTGVDMRFTLLFGAQLGLLGTIARRFGISG